MHKSRLKVAVVGHVEWVLFARAAHVPRAGEVVHAHGQFEEPAGGGAVAAVQLARLAGGAVLVTALGEDDLARRSIERLHELSVEVWSASRPVPTRRAVTLVDDAGERTITTFGDRLEPVGEDRSVPWDRLAEMDAVYFTAGDLGALRAARAARVLVASPRAAHALGHGVRLDALVLSEDDAIERREAARAQQEAELVVLTEGGRGGTYRRRGGGWGGAVGGWGGAVGGRGEAVGGWGGASGGRGEEVGGRDREAGEQGTWQALAPPGPVVDSYGCGDSFAAGLTYGLGLGLEVADALALAARCGAVCLTGRGPYERQYQTGP